MITIEQIERTFDNIDKINRPYAALINPEDYKELASELNTIEDKILIKEHPYVPRGKIYIVDRKYFDNP